MDLTQIIAQHKAEIDRLGLQLYQPSFETDYLFLHWWLTLNETGDLKRLIFKGNRKLSAFYQVFAPPAITLYTRSVQGAIDFVMWLRPASGASDEQTVFASMWGDRGKAAGGKNLHGTRKGYDLIRLIYTVTFAIWPSVLGTTWQPELLEIHKKMGYDIVGVLPNIHGQEYLWFMHLTKEKFENSRFYQVGFNRRT